MSRSGRSIAALWLSLVPVVALAQPAAVPVQVIPVVPGLAMLVGSGGNIGVSYGLDGIFLVDDQYAPQAESVLEAVRRLVAAREQASGPLPDRIRFILNTHWHGDHTGGNEPLGATGALIVAHENVRRRMSVEQFNQLLSRATPPSPLGALPVVTFSESVAFNMNGHRIEATHVPPAHTDGDAIVWFGDANVVHMGDTFFNGVYPFIDLDSGGSIDGVIAVSNTVLARSNDQTRIMPGHGPLASRADLVRYRDLLVTARDRVQRLIGEGKSLEQIIAAKPLAEYDADWTWAFITGERFLTILHRGLVIPR